ncbi:MAG: glycine cleavage system protein GcvH [Nannocystaceae bacterium]|nr:glycine cleavage system protein GcvH [Nannocystaceae bacterium]
MSENIPADLRYTKEHEWVRVQGDNLVIGITAHAVEQLGDITLVSLPEVGAVVKAGETFGDIDSVKAVSELFAPVDGEVTEINGELEDAPEQVNDAPFGNGWMLKLKPAADNAHDGLMTAEAYSAYLADLA